jgi:hypothetical protein
MLRAIGRFLSSVAASLWKGTLGVLSWTEQLIRWPFSLVFGNGGGMPTPDYKPDVTSAQLLDEFAETRARQAAILDLDRDGIGTVLKFANANRSVRAGMDLSAVKADVRATLLTMDDNELQALSVAGPGKVRKFIEGKDHGIFGVPVVRPAPDVIIPPPTAMMPHEQVLWRTRARIVKSAHSQDLKLVR